MNPLLAALLEQPHGLPVFRLVDGAIAACSAGACERFGARVRPGDAFAALLASGSLPKWSAAAAATAAGVWELQLAEAGEARMARFLVVPIAAREHVVVALPFEPAYVHRLEQRFLDVNAELASQARELSRRAADYELHSVIVRNMAEGVCLVRAADLKLVYANPRLEQIFGYGAGELAGRSVVSLCDVGDTTEAAVASRMEALARVGASYEVRCRRRDDARIWCRGRVTAFTHPLHGAVWVMVQADVTAEKEASDRLRRQEKLLQSVFDLLPVGVWITDATGRIVNANPAGLRIWGGARYVGMDHYGEYQGWWVDTGEPIAADEWALARAIRRGESAVGQLLRIRSFDGTYRTILNSAMPLRDRDTIIGAIAVNEDVTRVSEAEALFSGVVAAAPDAIVAADSERRITVFNAGAERVFACERREAIGGDVGSLVAAEQRAEFEALLRAAESQPLVEPRVLVGRRRSGAEFPVETSVASMRDGGLRRYALVLRDVTARVEADNERARLMRALADERTWLRALLRTAPMGVITFDADGTMACNQRAEELLNGVLRGGCGSARRPDGAPLSAAELPTSRVRSGERMAAEEFLLVRDDGARVWILGSAAPVIGAGGQQIGAIGVFADISAQKRQEEEQRLLAGAGQVLSHSLDYEETLHKVARFAVPDLADGCVVALVDADGELRPAAFFAPDPEVMRALERLLGRQVARAARASERRVLAAPELVPTLLGEDWRAHAHDCEHLDRLRQAGARSCLTVPLVARGEMIGEFTLFHAGSRRTMRAEDLPLAEAMARRAGLAIDNARLYRAARTATQARDDLLAVVAHDLRNPLGTIVMGVEWLARRLSGDEHERTAVEGIVRSAQRIDRLIGDLLDVAQLETGKLALSREPLAPADVIDEAVACARPLAGGRTVTGEAARTLPPVWADRDRILQVLSNLLGNALKFTPPEGRVAVAAERSDGEVCFRVRDTGPGIPRAQLPHVFDRFWRGAPGDRRGAGLGLAIVKGIVEAHGGRVWVESEPGAGALFFFTLPVAGAPTGDENVFKDMNFKT